MVTYNELVVLDFTEKEVNDRGTNAWGANYVFSSGGLQNDITLIAHKFDYGYVPAASGSADLGASGTPFRTFYADRPVFGSPDMSGVIYMYGGNPTAEQYLYSLTIDTQTGVVNVARAPQVGEFG